MRAQQRAGVATPGDLAPQHAGRHGSPGALLRAIDPLAAWLAGIVAAFLAVTPLTPDDERFWSDGTQGIAYPVVAGAVVVAGVLLAPRRPVLGTAVLLLPYFPVAWNRWFAWGWLLALICAVVVVGYRRGWLAGLAPTAGALLVAAYYCSTDIVAMLPIGPVTSGAEAGDGGIVFALHAFWIIAVLVASLAARTWRRAGEREQQAARQREEADTVATLAAERSRMARDLHDVVAHHMSLVAVRAESAPFQHDLDEGTTRLLGDIADDARAALAELRQALAVLRRTEDVELATRPQPTAADVDELLDGARAAGQQIEETGAWGSVPAGPGYVLFRAVQEGLTNVRRHAPGAPVSLTRTREGAVVGLLLSNPANHPDGPLRRGRGLLGMAERVESLGGSLDATARDGVVRLALTLPVAGGA